MDTAPEIMDELQASLFGLPTVRFLRISPEAKLPAPATKGAAGWDICSIADVSLLPGQTNLVRTGWRVAVPSGYELQVRSRSGMALKGVVVANSPGTIDSDYRGEIGVLLLNTGQSAICLEAGSRVAQLVLAPVVAWAAVEANYLDPTDRGDGGFGHTGVK